MNAYLILLDGYKDLEPIYLMCITKMFHRIMVKRRAEFLLWKVKNFFIRKREQAIKQQTYRFLYYIYSIKSSLIKRMFHPLQNSTNS